MSEKQQVIRARRQARKTTEIKTVQSVAERKRAPRNAFKRIYFDDSEYQALLESAEKAGFYIAGVTDETCAIEAYILRETGVTQ